MTPWTTARQALESITISQNLLKLVSIECMIIERMDHPLLSPCPLAFNLSQHQGLFKRVTSSLEVAKVLEFQLQDQSFQ